MLPVFCTIGGGSANNIQTNASFATIGGGVANAIQAAAQYAMIGGGSSNVIQGTTYGATIGGGDGNTNGGAYTTIGGGYQNMNSGFATTIPGGYDNIASGSVSFAAGELAQATNSGAFVWGDASGQVTSSTNNNSVTMRASGGYRFFTSSTIPGPGVYLAPSGTSWTAISDRNAKKNIVSVNYEAVLDKLARVPDRTMELQLGEQRLPRRTSVRWPRISSTPFIRAAMTKASARWSSTAWNWRPSKD